MKATELLATSLNRRDDEPNQQLADEIIRNNRKEWVKELVENLENRDKNIQSDSIKTLYEIGERGAAELIAPYANDFGKLLQSKNNRLVWGTMIALDAITEVNPQKIFSLLPEILATVDKGSVITIDHGVSILAKLSSVEQFSEQTFPLLLEQLRRCPAKQLPMYAEKSVAAVNDKNKKEFSGLLEQRLSELEKDTQKKRIERVMRKLK
jgi:hypothetical protein